MSSIGAFTFSAGVSMYAAAKAGLQAFTRSMAAAYDLLIFESMRSVRGG